jgi:hypothetical protein
MILAWCKLVQTQESTNLVSRLNITAFLAEPWLILFKIFSRMLNVH